MTIRKIGNIEYEFTRKRVKNINLRIRPDGAVCVSAPNFVAAEKVDAFVLSKADFIAEAQRKMTAAKPVSNEIREYMKNFTDEQYRKFFVSLVDKYYPMFEPFGIEYPTIKIREMKTRWGSCMPSKNIITLNKLLAAVPKECAEYVVVHEFCHFFEQNHSKKFYAWVERFMPDWQSRRNRLKEYVLY